MTTARRVKTTSAPTRILGVDPGSVATGWGVIDYFKGKSTLVEFGVVRTTRGADLSVRLKQIYEGVSGVISQHEPDCVAVESPFHGKSTKSLIQLAHARGVILLAAEIAELRCAEYSPRSVKSAVVGYGGAEKEQVAHMVRVLIAGMEKKRAPADATDALAVAICHAHTGQTRSRLIETD